MSALDYTQRISPDALRAAGVTDVLRYLCFLPVGDWKVIKPAEYHELRNAGIGVTLNWEFDARDWLNASNARAHAAMAAHQAAALGYPTGCTIFGSCDFDMSRAQWNDSGRLYASLFASQLRMDGYRPGVYGPWDVLQWVRDEGIMDRFWQAGMSTSWSSGRNRNAWPGAHLRQRRHRQVGGVDTDENDILIKNWNQNTSKETEDMPLTPEEWRNIRNPNEILWQMINGAEVINGVQLPTSYVNVENKPQLQLNRIEQKLDSGVLVLSAEDRAAIVDGLKEGLREMIREEIAARFADAGDVDND